MCLGEHLLRFLSAPLTVFGVLLCLAATADAQDLWRSHPQPLPALIGGTAAQADPTTGQTNNPGQTAAPRTPTGISAGASANAPNVRPDAFFGNPATMFPPAQSYSGGNYDWPPQPQGNTPPFQGNTPPPQGNTPPLKITRLTQFPLPFKITQANLDTLTSLELVYSVDRGQNWYHYQHLPPTEITTFEFNVPEDGEYWFVCLAVLKTGEIRQIGATPAARVLVDTVPPKLTVNARRNSSGEVIIVWTAEDAALKNVPPSISLSYDANATWMTLAIDPIKNVRREDDNRETGSVTFWPRHEAEAVEIRCELEDAAENREIQTTRLILKPSPTEATLVPIRPVVDETTSLVGQQDADETVLPPKPLVSNKPLLASGQLVDRTAASASASDLLLADLLKTLGSEVPSVVAAEVTQPYAGEFSAASGDAPAASGDAPQDRQDIANTTGIADTAPGIADTAPAVSGAAPVTPAFPGKITLVSKGHYDDKPCIIVRWMTGEESFADASAGVSLSNADGNTPTRDECKVDLYRSETKYGPWRPIAFDLKNTGEHFWLIGAADQMPFFLRVDLRSPEGLYTDFTVHSIVLPLSLKSDGER